MKCITFLAVFSLCASAILAQKPIAPAPSAIANVPAIAPTLAPAPTLSQDLEGLMLLVPSRPINKLIVRYLLNDAEFQAVIRIMNSHDAYMLRMRIMSQPEVIGLTSWVRTQLMLSGGSFEMEESEELLTLFNPTPYWAVYGWQGFFNEFLAYFPQAMIRAHIDMKVMQNGIMAQFWQRLVALKPVYERVLAFPESQRMIAQLQTHGVDTNQLDQFIRSQFDWFNVTTAAAGAAGAPSFVMPAAPAFGGPAPPAFGVPVAPVQ